MQMILLLRRRCVSANRRVYKKKRVELETYNNPHFDVKLAPELFYAKIIICITFLDTLGVGSMQVIGFKMWLQIG
jgi:hypothetical protein